MVILELIANSNVILINTILSVTLKPVSYIVKIKNTKTPHYAIKVLIYFIETSACTTKNGLSCRNGGKCRIVLIHITD